MAWRFKSDWVSAPRNPNAQDLDNISLDQRYWGGHVDAAQNNLINLGVLTFGAGGYINGKVGIGTANPNGVFAVHQASAAGSINIDIFNSATSDTANRVRLRLGPSSGFVASPHLAPYIEAYCEGAYSISGLALGTYGSTGLAERMRITSGGNVGIGTTAPATLLHIVGADGPIIGIGHASWPTKYYATISGFVYNGNNETAGHMVFSSRRADGGPLIERMRIDPWGNTGIGQSAPKALLHVGQGATFANYSTVNATDWAQNLYVSGADWHYIGPYAGIALQMTDGELDIYTAPTGTTDAVATLTNRFRLTNAGALTITSTAAKPGGGTWSDTSDARTKRNIEDFADGLSVIRNLRPVRYEANGLAGTIEGYQGISLVAQEAREHAPYCVGTRRGKLREDDAEDTDILNFDFTPLLYALLNAAKELDTRLTALEAR